MDTYMDTMASYTLNCKCSKLSILLNIKEKIGSGGRI